MNALKLKFRIKMKHTDFTMNKTTTSKFMNMQTVRKITLCLALLIPFHFVYGQYGPDINEPDTATIESANVNMPTAGILISQYHGSHISLCIDKIADCNPKTAFVTPRTAFYILWEGTEAQAIDNYSITAAGDSPRKDPRTWTLSGSHDNQSWTFLDRQQDQTFHRRAQVKEYLFDNTTAYKYYKLDIESNAGDPSTQIAEWTMQFIGNDIMDIMQFAGGDTHADYTPMGRKFEYRHQTTDEDRLWLNDPEMDAPLPEGDTRRMAPFSVLLYDGMPMPTDVIQHAINNCAVAAVLASMAYQYPEYIKSIIKDNGNRTYTIGMYDPKGNPIDVCINSKLLANEKGQAIGITGRNNTPNWSTLLEKALMKYNHIYKISGNYDLAYIGAEHILAVLTGNGDSFSFAKYSLNPKDLNRAVNISLKQGKFVLGGFGVQDWGVDGSKTVSAHVYTFMHSPYRDAMFLMRNPWGNNPVVGDRKEGYLRIPDAMDVAPSIDIRVVEPGAAAKFKTAQ